MSQVTVDDVRNYVENNIGSFHAARLRKLEELKLDQMLKRKNPYLFRAKNLLHASDLIKTFLDAHLSSQEETIFGQFLEGLVIFVNEKVYGGWKSSTEGIDLEFNRENIRYLVSIKSGPNWGNSSQIKKMKDNFTRAQKILRQQDRNMNIQAVNGCCYGRDNHPDKDGYFKYCGQRFWVFISGNADLYTEIIEPLGHRAKERNEEFSENYNRVMNKFSESFMKRFCEDGRIQWQKLLHFNSGYEPPASD